jgi:hypothetical protein
MTFKDLQKLAQSQSHPKHIQLFQRLKNKPFWIRDQRPDSQQIASHCAARTNEKPQTTNREKNTIV